MAKTGPQRTRMQAAQDREVIADMYCRGRSQWEIANKLGLAQSTISYDLKKVRAVWRERSVANFDIHVANELAKIDTVERTYWEAWAKSQQPRRKSEKASTFRGEKYSTESASTELEAERDGNPEFLKGVERCIRQRIDLLGIKAPEMWERADWQREMQAAGIDETEAFETLVKHLQERRVDELVEVLA